MPRAYWKSTLLLIVLMFFVFWLFLLLLCWHSYITPTPRPGRTQSYVNYRLSAVYVQKWTKVYKGGLCEKVFHNFFFLRRSRSVLNVSNLLNSVVIRRR